MKHRVLLQLSLLFSLALVSTPRALALAVSANVVGRHYRYPGASIPDAKVTLTEQATGVSATRTTNSSGNFEFPNIPPGTYTVSAEHVGFQTAKSSNTSVIVNTSTRADLTLSVGSETHSRWK